MSTTAKKIPKFKSEDEERAFWAEHSPLDYFDVTTAKKAAFPKLRPSLRSISLRLPEDMIDNLKVLANKKDVPYQSLMKIFLAKQIEQEKYTISQKARQRKRKTV